MAKGAKGGKGSGAKGRPGKNLTKERILAAMAVTKSNRSAARYLNVNYGTYKKYARLYVDENGVQLNKKHNNRQGKGIPKFLNNGKKEPPLLDLITGKIDAYSFNPQKIKYRLIEEGYLKEECYNCGFHERRVLDYKMPIILNFRDKNKNNWNVDNLEFLCYNCYYMNIGDLFTEKVVKKLEDNTSHITKEEIKDFDLDDYQRERLENLGIIGNNKPKLDEDGSEFISRI